jgi:ABC-type glycerol-3-phosphate transport system substrate-binding protein
MMTDHSVPPAGARLARRAIAGRLAAAGTLLGAACGLPVGSGAGAGPAGANEPVRVTLISRTAEEEAFTRRVAEFGEKYPRITLDYQPLPGSYPEVIRTNAAAGTLADVIYLQNLVFQGLAVSGDIQPIDRLVQRDKINLKQWYESGISGLRLDGKLFGLPARGQIQNCYLYYNRDAFQSAGLRLPHDAWTLDDLVAAADRLTVRDGSRYGSGTAWGSFQQTIAAMRRFGGDLLSLDGKRCLADSPQALQAMQWHWDLWHRRQVLAVKPAAPADFGNGAIAMAGQMLAGARANVRNAVKEAFEWSMVLMPKGPTGKLGADTSLAPVSLNARTKVLDQGWLVAQWLTDRETGVALGLQSRGSTTPGMRKDVYCDERLLADPNYPREMLERVCKAMDLSPTVPYVVPANYRQTELNEVITKHMTAFRENTATPSASAMRAFTAEAQAVLDLPRGGG